MSTSSCGIIPNPDISGIGVRTAIYAQAVLTLIQPILAGWDGHITNEELDHLHELYLGILLPGCALVFSAIIQARTFGLSFYHGAIVLNLSWINNTSALLFFEFAIISRIEMGRTKMDEVHTAFRDSLHKVKKILSDNRVSDTERQQTFKKTIQDARKLQAQLGNKGRNVRAKRALEFIIMVLTIFYLKLQVEARNEQNKSLASKTLKMTDSDNVNLDNNDPIKIINELIDMFGLDIEQSNHWWAWIEEVRFVLQRRWGMAILASAHLTLLSTFGLWLWINNGRFESKPVDCVPSTHLNIIFHSIPILSPTFQRLSEALYGIFVTPFVNILLFVIPKCLLMELLEALGCFGRKLKSKTLSANKLSAQNQHPSKNPPLIGSSRILNSFIFITFLVQIYLITSTELTIKTNGRLLNQDEEEKWTFGQTLAVALTIIPLTQVAKQIRENIMVWRKKKLEFQQGSGNAMATAQFNSPPLSAI